MPVLVAFLVFSGNDPHFNPSLAETKVNWLRHQNADCVLGFPLAQNFSLSPQISPFPIFLLSNIPADVYVYVLLLSNILADVYQIQKTSHLPSLYQEKRHSVVFVG